MGLLAEHAELTGAVVAGTGAPRTTTYAPFTGEPLAELPVSTPADVDRAYAVAREAQQRWARVPLPDRSAVFLRLHDLLLDRQAEVLDLVQLETGKARRHALEELVDVALTARHYARSARRYLAPVRHAGLVPLLSSARELRHPKGVVGIVSPWNYPLTLAVSDCDPGLPRGQRRRAQARHPDRADRAVDPRAGGRGRAARRALAGRRRRRAGDRPRGRRRRRLRLLHRLDAGGPGGRRAVRATAGRLLPRARRQEPDAGARRRRPRPRGRGRGARLLQQRGPAVHLDGADLRRRERARRVPRPVPRAGRGPCAWAPSSATARTWAR